jgi:hypothetical protein
MRNLIGLDYAKIEDALGDWVEDWTVRFDGGEFELQGDPQEQNPAARAFERYLREQGYEIREIEA